MMTNRAAYETDDAIGTAWFYYITDHLPWVDYCVVFIEVISTHVAGGLELVPNTHYATQLFWSYNRFDYLITVVFEVQWVCVQWTHWYFYQHWLHVVFAHFYNLWYPCARIFNLFAKNSLGGLQTLNILKQYALSFQNKTYFFQFILFLENHFQGKDCS